MRNEIVNYWIELLNRINNKLIKIVFILYVYSVYQTFLLLDFERNNKYDGFIWCTVTTHTRLFFNILTPHKSFLFNTVTQNSFLFMNPSA